jgi:hypothetical protein
MTYTEAQIFRAAPYPLTQENTAEHMNGQIKIKIHSPRGETNWLNITPDQLKKIELLLLETDQ